MEQKMQKDELMQMAGWCTKICPKLAAYNKAFILRKGKGLFHINFLNGSEESINYAVKKEAELFYAAGLAEDEHFYTDQGNHGVYLFNKYLAVKKPWYDEKITDGSIFFFKDKTDEQGNFFDIDGCEQLGIVDEIVANLGLTVNAEDLRSWLTKYEPVNSADEFINNTIVRHFELHDDDELHEDDLNWMQLINVTDNIEKNEKPEKMLSIQPVVSDKDVTKTEKVTSKEELKMGTIVSDVTVESTVKTEKAESKDEKKSEETVEIQYTDFEDIVAQTKENITEKEAAFNQKKLEELLPRYKEVYDYVCGLNNAKWNTIKNKLKDAMEHKYFEEQFAAVYLTFSDDNTNPLYSKLFYLDEDTRKFKSEIVHMEVNLTCPHCFKNWAEDVTFLKPGGHNVKCPNCGEYRGYEKPCLLKD